jgi:hypothetical protein
VTYASLLRNSAVRHGRFDKRYRDVFAPAIEAAGLEPYRVDRDPEVSVVIDEIENRIREADVCLVDITSNNPNVWFELGFALASKKEVCLICANERVDRYPFDVQHRLIIKYSCESSSDFDYLRTEITKRLNGIQSKLRKLNKVIATPIRETEGLSDHEIAALCAILSNRTHPEALSSIHEISNDVNKMGYTKIAAQIAVEKLIRKDLIEISEGKDWDNRWSQEYTYEGYRITSLGMEWLISNEGSLNLKEEHTGKDLLDEIPF